MYVFIVTAKLSKKRAVVIVLAIALLICTVIILAGRRDRASEHGDRPAAERRVQTEADLVSYLESLGWQVDPSPIEVREVLIPREFDHVFEAYNHMQREAGFDLAVYRGLPAVRYTFTITNYPGHYEGVVADLLIADGRIIVGDIQSIHLDGFIHALFPNREA